MKKFFSFALVASAMVAGFASCSNDEDGVAQQGQAQTRVPMDFTAKAKLANASRGVATSSGSVVFTDFQTWAYDDTTNGLYMGTSGAVGKTVTYSVDKWDYTPKQYWPVNPLNFVAVAPAAPNGVTNMNTSSTSNVVTFTSDIELSTDVESQDDIMFANADDIEKGDNNGNVSLSFGHALSQVVFKGKLPTNGAVTKVTMAEISLCNVNKKGTLAYTSLDAYSNTSETPATFTLEASDMEGSVFEAGANSIVAGTPFDLTVSNNADKKNAWFMLPQTTAAWTGPAAIGATPAEGAYLKIRAKLEKDGVVILNNEESDAFYIPLAINWEKGKKYIYTIEFNGSSALKPITFSVAAADWTDAAQGDISF